MWGDASFDDGEIPALDIDKLEDADLLIIAEKIIALMERDALIDRERNGLHDRWSNWQRI